jgi:hypothetical protein
LLLAAAHETLRSGAVENSDEGVCVASRWNAAAADTIEMAAGG